MRKPCGRCGHLKGKHRHTIDFSVPPNHPGRVTYRCEGDCDCKRHTDEDKYYGGRQP